VKIDKGRGVEVGFL